MIRNAFKMKLKAGFEAEYEKRHDEIWPELSAELSADDVVLSADTERIEKRKGIPLTC